MPVRYLTVAETLDLYALTMQRTVSEPQTLRSMDGLSSSIHRAQMAAHDAGADVVAQAARLAVGISRAQAMLDGNRCLGYAAMATHLRLNGMRFHGDSLEGAGVLESCADPRVSPDEADERFEDWLRTHAIPAPADASTPAH